jgi:hypothetical protein
MRSRRSLVLVLPVVLAVAGITSFAHADTPPLTIPADQTLEAHDATGAPLTFTVSASDAGVDLDASCDHPVGGSGHGTFQLTDTFALGATVVTCKTTVAGTDVTATFTVTVRDTTSPDLVVPAPITVDATSSAGAAATDPAVAAFLAAPTAHDLVDPAPVITNDGPAIFPVGTTQVLFVARDNAGNLAAGQSSVTVQAPPPKTPAAQPPADVGDLKAKAGNRFVLLTWTLPTDPGFDHLVVYRTNVTRGGRDTPVYEGTAASYRDGGVNNGSRYRYLVVSVDQAGNRSAGVTIYATPVRDLLTSPRDGAKVAAPPRLTWVAARTARYYNVQLWHGTKKILSAWPTKNTLTLKRQWAYQGHRYRLTRGRYRWYVWPGFGSRSLRQYGAPLGTSAFQLVR